MGADVAFVGETPEAMSYMAGTDVYVLPSWRDTSPRVVRKAMSLSLPTIVSDIPLGAVISFSLGKRVS